MSPLVKKQQRFAYCLAELISIAFCLGYGVRFGDAYRDSRVHYGHPKSCHRFRLAVDLILDKDGQYLTATSDYEELGEIWEKLDPQARWGGWFGDGNHFSFEHEGIK